MASRWHSSVRHLGRLQLPKRPGNKGKQIVVIGLEQRALPVHVAVRRCHAESDTLGRHPAAGRPEA